MEQKFIFILHLERTVSGEYWGYIAQMPHISRVVGENLQDVGGQLIGQLGYMAEEMPPEWKVEVQTEYVINVP